MDDIDGDASPMSGDEPPHPEPVLAEAAAEPSPYGYAHEIHHILSHLLLLLASGRLPVHSHIRHDPDGYIVVTHLIGGDGAYGNGGFGGVPASEEAMAALPETTVQGEGEIVGEKECAVCLETYEAGDTVRTLPCSHGFHERCIFQWLRVSRLCPLCRFALPAAAEETDSSADEEDDDDSEDDDNSDSDEDDDNTLEI